MTLTTSEFSGTLHRPVQRALCGVLIVSTAIPAPGQVTGWGLTVFPFTLVLIPLCLAWAMDARFARRSAGPRQLDPIVVCFVVLVSLMGLSNAVAGGSWRNVCLWSTLGLFYVFARYRMPRLVEPSRFARWLAFMVIVIGVICAVQYVTVSSFGALAQYLPGGEVQNSQVFDVAGELKRVQGPFIHTNLLAQWATYVMLWMISFSRISVARLARFAILICAVIILLTFARAAWVIAPLTAGGLVLALYRRGFIPASRLVAALLVSLFLMVAVVQLAPSSWFARFESDQGSSQVRSDALRAGLARGSENPYFGIGYANFVQRDPGFGQKAELAPHNIFVLIWSEQGIFVVAAFIALLMAFFVVAHRLRGRVPPRDPLRLAVFAILGAWIGFSFFYVSAVDHALSPSVILLCAFSLGTVTRRSALPRYARSPRRQLLAGPSASPMRVSSA